MFSAVALPLTYLPILVVANDPDYMGDKSNGRFANVARRGVPRHHHRRLRGGDPADDLHEGGSVSMAGRVIHGRLHLLDRQVVSKRDGRLVGKVDDLELEVDVERPYVCALLTGPQALGGRLPGLLGGFVRSVHRRLHPDPDPGPNAIPAGRIVDITSAVQIDSHDGLAVAGFGDWLESQVVCRIPGASHEA